MAFHNLYFFSQTQKKQMGYIITSNSDPLYDRGGWDDYWSANDWIRWHKELKKDFGLQKANEIFIKAYTEPPSDGFWSFLGGLEIYSHYNYRTIDTAFKKYAKENNFYEALFKGLGGLLSQTASVAYSTTDTAVNTIDNAVEAAGNVAHNTVKGVENLSNLIKYGLPVLVILAIYLGYKFFLNTKFAKAL